MTASDETTNPYAAPTARIERPLRAHGLFLKWMHLIALLAGPVVFYGARDRAVGGALVAWPLLAMLVIGVTWLAIAWTNFPPEDLHFTNLGRFTPFSATLRLFVPIYGVYWTYVNLSLLSRAINDSLTRRSMPMRAPFALAAAGATLLIIANIRASFSRDLDATLMLYWAAGALWFFYMLQADVARRFMILACLAGREKIALARATMEAGGDANALAGS